MLAYAANAPRIAERRSAPNTLLFIIAGHVAMVAAVMSARMELPPIVKHPPIDIFWVPKPKDPPPPNPVQTRQAVQQHSTTVAHPTVDVRTTAHADPMAHAGPTGDANPFPILGATGSIELPPPHFAVKFGPELATPAAELKPPYPSSKLLTEEEAVLRLRLTIGQNGRVIAVDPVGAADRAFLDAARRHLLAHWRYKPASEDGRPVISSTVITLRFQLDG
jgi:protein TonB